MNGQRIGYVWVSTVDQNTERQLEGVEVDRTGLGSDRRPGPCVSRLKVVLE